VIPGEATPADRGVATPGDATAWHKLHPLTPVVRAGPVVLVLVVAVASSARSRRPDDSVWLYELGLIVVTLGLGIVRWLVTRWRLEGTTLRIETGLLRRDSRQLPVARIQAVDVLRPFLARVLGLAELRIRLAGSSSAGGKLAYLSEPVALDLRARLLAGHHGLDMATPEPAELPVAVVPTGRLAGSVVLSSATLVPVLLVVAAAVTQTVSPAAAVAIGGTLAAYLVILVRVVWRRVSEQYGFTVSQAPDGIRIRRGLLGTVSETIPLRRVQAVRKQQPLLWRPFGWCRLEVEIAGGAAGGGQGTRAGTVTKALLPVGTDDAVGYLAQGVLGPDTPPLSRPPPRARWKAPLSYHFLAVGLDASLAMAVTGRVRKVTCWVPLDKVQSVRLMQGPVQRLFRLSTVHVDAAGRRVRAEFRDRDAGEAERLFGEIAARSRSARRNVTAPTGTGSPPAPATTDAGAVPVLPPGVAPPPGWYRDPAGRHQLRHWDGAGWGEHVADDGRVDRDRLDPDGPGAP
jgi:putative membrane protein